MGDKYDELKGDPLDQAVRDAGGVPTDGEGENADGSWSAREKRAYLRDQGYDISGYDTAGDDDDDDVPDDGRDGDDASDALSDAELAEAQSLPLTPTENAALRDAHSRGDVDAIERVTADVNARREQDFAASR